MADMNTCGTCMFWEKNYPRTNRLGDCIRISIDIAPNSQAVLVAPPCKCHPDAPATQAVIFSTMNDFGCVAWQLNMNG